MKGDKGDKGDTGSTGATGQTGATGASGKDGKDGVSPTITLKETASGVFIEVTNADGTISTALVLHGNDGADGSPG